MRDEVDAGIDTGGQRRALPPRPLRAVYKEIPKVPSETIMLAGMELSEAPGLAPIRSGLLHVRLDWPDPGSAFAVTIILCRVPERQRFQQDIGVHEVGQMALKKEVMLCWIVSIQRYLAVLRRWQDGLQN